MNRKINQVLAIALGSFSKMMQARYHSKKFMPGSHLVFWVIKVTVNVFDTKFGFRSLKAELLTESR